jgi:phospholipid-translocating ATPase
MGKEAYDDYKRHLRDQEANSARYLILDSSSSVSSATPTRAVPSSKLRVGDLLFLEKNQRIPADLVLLRTSDVSGTCFIRTDQLDGETDWKLKVAVPSCQKVENDGELLKMDAELYGKHSLLLSLLFREPQSNYVFIAADAPMKDIHTFIGTFTLNRPPSTTGEMSLLPPKMEPLTVENVLWANTVLAAGSAVGFVIYTGEETRAVMNTSHPETKVGLLDLEINRLAKVG